MKTLLLAAIFAFVTTAAFANHGGLHGVPPGPSCTTVNVGTALIPKYVLVCK
jgi:hypothetical protein